MDQKRRCLRPLPSVFFFEKVFVSCVLLTILAEKSVRKAKFAFALIGLSATVVGEKRVVARGDRGFRPVVHVSRTHHALDDRYYRLHHSCHGLQEVGEAVMESNKGELAEHESWEENNNCKTTLDPHLEVLT